MTSSPLLRFLSQGRKYALHSVIPPGVERHTPVLVVGNSAADLDSFVSAVVYAFLGSRYTLQSSFYVPILNMANTRSEDLWRLRPEFGTALRLSIASLPILAGVSTISDSEPGEKDFKKIEKSILGNLTTIADIFDAKDSPLLEAFRGPNDTGNEPPPNSNIAATRKPSSVVLVDHNALSFSLPVHARSLDREKSLAKEFNIIGCIDHHVEEDKVPKEVEPRIIETKAGSCCSLITNHFNQERNFWEDEQSDEEAYELAKIALSAILIDTANLETKDKTRESDRIASTILNSYINRYEGNHDISFDQAAFYTEINNAKLGAPENLLVSEILEMDFKDWFVETESATVKLGIASCTRSLDWLIAKSDSDSEGPQEASKLLRELEKLGERKGGIDLLVIMTAFKDGREEGAFQRELLFHALVPVTQPPTAQHSIAKQAADAFFSDMGQKLDLEKWLPSLPDFDQPDDSNNFDLIKGKAFRQQNTSYSRKQVAPLFRASITDSGKHFQKSQNHQNSNG